MEVLVHRRHREECYEVLHLEPYWRVEEVRDANLPDGIPDDAACFVYRRQTRS
ncbi:hypothetical protein JCM14635_26610 [Megalodesulfovibrio paquesii]